MWYDVNYNEEVYDTFRTMLEIKRNGELMSLESIGQKSGYGEEGTGAMLKKLEKLGLIKLKIEVSKGNNGERVEFIEQIDFDPQGIMDYVIKNLVSEVKFCGKFEKSLKETKELTKGIEKLAKTRFFKQYLFENLLSRGECLRNLTQIHSKLLDLLVDFEPLDKKILENKEEYDLLLKVSKKAKEFDLLSNKKKIMVDIENYFTKDPKEKQLLEAIQKEMGAGIDMVPIKDIYKKMKEKGFNKKETNTLLKQIQEKGDIYVPRKDFLKPTLHTPKRWLE